MPRGKGKKYNAAQRAGMEFSGNMQQNGVQPRGDFNDLSPKEQAGIIKRTGQMTRADAPADPRHFAGQMGEKPKNKLEDRIPPPGYYGY